MSLYGFISIVYVIISTSTKQTVFSIMIILGMGSTFESRRYIVTPSLIG